MSKVIDNIEDIASIDLKAPLASPALTGIPTAPTATAGTNNTQVATTAFATSQDLGVNQTWQDVTVSRINGVTYTNTTGKPITVSIRVDVNTNTYIQLMVNGIEASRCGTSSTTYIRMSIEATVPSGATYKLNYDTGTPVYMTWSELR